MMDAMKWMAKNALDAVRISPTFPLRHISALFNRKYHSAKIKGVGRIYFRPKSSDAETFIQVFRKREYDLSFYGGQYQRALAAYDRILSAGQIPMIIDGGANAGAASVWFATRFPEAQVLAVEPDAARFVGSTLALSRTSK